jgi:hypothetical protein
MGDPGATTLRAAVWLFISALVAAAIAIIARSSFDILAALTGLDSLEAMLPSLVRDVAFLAPIAALLSVPSLMGVAGIAHLIVRGLGGSGTYRALFYLSAASLAPLFIAYGVLSFPLISCLSPALVVYGVVLNVIAIETVHRIGWGKAITTSGLTVGAVLIAALPIVANRASSVPGVPAALAVFTASDIVVLGYAILVNGSACLGCFILPLPTLIVGILSGTRPKLRPWFYALLAAMLVSIALAVGGIVIGERLGLPDPSIA